MNRWKKVFLMGFPNLTSPVRLMQMTRDDPNGVLWAKVSVEADRRVQDIEETLPQLLQEALGPQALEHARHALRSGRELEREAHFICLRAAMISCYAQDPRQVPTLELMTVQISQVLFAEATPHQSAADLRWKSFLRTAQPYNRLPC